MSTPVRMTVAGLSIDQTTKTPVLILKEQAGDSVLPIYIGLMEASAIAAQLESIQLSRPMTHDLLKSVLLALGGTLVRVEVNDLRDNTFYASLFVQHGDRVVEIDSRPSDAIAIALRTGSAIFVASHVLALSAKRAAPESQADAEVPATPVAEAPDPVPKVLFVQPGPDDSADPDKWKELLEKLEPDDFGKYKM